MVSLTEDVSVTVYQTKDRQRDSDQQQHSPLKLELLNSQAATKPAYIHQGNSQSIAAKQEEEGGGEEGYVSTQQGHSPFWQLLRLSSSLQA